MNNLKLDRFLDQFVAGSVVFVGSWYLHRAVLLEYFPNLAGGAAVTLGGIDVKASAIFFGVGSVSIGVFLSHFADLLAVVAFNDAGDTTKSSRLSRRVLRFLGRIVTWGPSADPRVAPIERYLRSPRRSPFLLMMEDWSMTTAETLELKNTSANMVNPSEAIVAHQHLVARLRAQSDPARQFLLASYSSTRFAASLALAFTLLIPVAGVSFLTSELVESAHQVLPTHVRVASTAAVYMAAVVSLHAFRRKFTDFTASIVTSALHFYRTSD